MRARATPAGAGRAALRGSYRQLVRDELGVEPDPEVVALEARIQQGTSRSDAEYVPPAHRPPSGSGRQFRYPRRHLRQAASVVAHSLVDGGGGGRRCIRNCRRGRGMEFSGVDGDAIDRNRVVVAAFENRTFRHLLVDLGSLAADTSKRWTSSVRCRAGGRSGYGFLRRANSDGKHLDLSVDADIRELARSVRAGTVVWGTIYDVGDSLVFQGACVRCTESEIDRQCAGCAASARGDERIDRGDSRASRWPDPSIHAWT